MSDGDGLRKGLGWKGASGIRASIIHSSMLKKGSDLAWRAPGFVEITCCDHRLLHKTTPEEFRNSCDLVAAAHARHRDGEITKTLLENIEKTEGIRYVPGGLAYDLRLRRLGFFEAITVEPEYHHRRCHHHDIVVIVMTSSWPCILCLGIGLQHAIGLGRPCADLQMNKHKRPIV